mmetsp:Transcript_50602/g.134704  ORF Transcript_50602/g.134704 Transcript_50602/m.134704 type:complete len:270 (+) Transcript_50602:510-1319(+)
MFIWSLRVEVVKEDASKSSGFATVLDVEILVSLLFHSRVPCWIVCVTDLLVRPMKVLDVINVQIRGSDVRASAKPPHSTIRFKVPIVEVYGGTVRVLRMHDGGDTTSEEGHLLPRFQVTHSVSASLCCCSKSFLWHLTVNDAEVHTSFFEDVAIGQHTTHTSTPRVSCVLLPKKGGLAIMGCDLFTDTALRLRSQCLKPAAYRVLRLVLHAQRFASGERPRATFSRRTSCWSLRRASRNKRQTCNDTEHTETHGRVHVHVVACSRVPVT